jgi:ElaB/YqjD/DUF883 family membrane-anchored ribosome-binding protein
VAIDQAKEKGRGATEGAADKAQEVVAQAKEQVQQKTDEVKVTASDKVRAELDTRSTEMGDQVASLGRALRTSAEQLQGEGKEPAAKAAHNAAEQADRLGRYLTSSSSDRLLHDIEGFGRRQPWAAGAIGAALGFVGARFLKASTESRPQTSPPPAESGISVSSGEGATQLPSGMDRPSGAGHEADVVPSAAGNWSR